MFPINYDTVGGWKFDVNTIEAAMETRKNTMFILSRQVIHHLFFLRSIVFHNQVLIMENINTNSVLIFNESIIHPIQIH